MERRKGEGVFSLIELIVLVLFIGMLTPIELPTLPLHDALPIYKAAESGLRNALVSAKTCFTDNDSYGRNATGLSYGDGWGTFAMVSTFIDTPSASADPKTISIAVPTDSTRMTSAYSNSGPCLRV